MVVICVDRSPFVCRVHNKARTLDSLHQNRSILVNQILCCHNMFASLFFTEVQINTPFPSLACLITKREEKRPKHILKLSMLLLKNVANSNTWEIQ